MSRIAEEPAFLQIFRKINEVFLMKKRVIVIGGGIAGLSAGVYAQKCGFDVTIMESHSIAGGNCTSWKRNGYLFEGGMHWLTGSGTKEPVHRIWRHIGALDDSVTVRYPEPFKEFEYEGTRIQLYRNIDSTEKYLLELSPSDAKEIKLFCKNVRKVSGLVMPITDLSGLRVTKKNKPSLRLLFAVMSANRVMRKFANISKEEYISRFNHQGIRDLFSYLTQGKLSAMSLFFPMGTRARGDGGFPKGGSLPFVGRIVKTYRALGGEILFNTRVDRVVTENGKAVGVEINGDIVPADAVIVTADTMAMDHLFDTPPKAPWLDEMRKNTEPTMCMLVSLGINADLRNYPKGYIFKLKAPIMFAGQEYKWLSFTNYADDPDYSPEGKTTMTTILTGDTYDFWKSAQENGQYEAEKEKISAEVIAALTAHIPEADGKVEVCDVTTPLTYERYCGNWKGSWMTKQLDGVKLKAYPSVVSNLSCVYFAGQRMRSPGGLPVAALSGRKAVQYLCRDTDTVFISEE
jgi:phytoene dehydrogenase-like protein